MLAVGVPDPPLINLDLPQRAQALGGDAISAALAMGAVEEARALLADETNLNARLVLEGLFLRLAGSDSVTPA